LTVLSAYTILLSAYCTAADVKQKFQSLRSACSGWTCRS